MDIVVNRIENTLFVRTSGRLDLDSAVEYGTKITDAMEDSEKEITEVILDFSEITFISSFGLRIILELFKQLKAKNGVLKLRNLSEQLRNSFKLVGFDKFLVFE